MKPEAIRLDPAALLRTAERQLARIETELPNDKGLAEIAGLTRDAVNRADGLIRKLQRVLNWHRLPVAFLTLALLGLALWVYLTFLHVSTLTLALPDRDASELKAKLTNTPRLHIEPISTKGSGESLELLNAGKVDLAFVQGGFAVPPGLYRREISSRELVLYFVRRGLVAPRDIHTVVTSYEHQGSHTVLTLLGEAMHLPQPLTVRFTWQDLVAGTAPTDDVDAVFAVKDPSDEQTLQATAVLTRAGFELKAPSLGARASRFDFLEPQTVAPHWFDDAPSTAVETLAVKTYLVAREGLTPRLLAQAAALGEDDNRTFAAAAVMPSTNNTSEALQGVDAFVGILVNIALAFLALLSLEAIRWRRPFHELNAIVSRLSLLQSQTDMLDIDDVTLRRHNRLVLGLVSDQLGLISSLASFYTQENASLLFNSISELVHERCNALKINIQLKILQSNVRD